MGLKPQQEETGGGGILWEYLVREEGGIRQSCLTCKKSFCAVSENICVLHIEYFLVWSPLHPSRNFCLASYFPTLFSLRVPIGTQNHDFVYIWGISMHFCHKNLLIEVNKLRPPPIYKDMVDHPDKFLIYFWDVHGMQDMFHISFALQPAK